MFNCFCHGVRRLSHWLLNQATKAHQETLHQVHLFLCTAVWVICTTASCRHVPFIWRRLLTAPAQFTLTIIRILASGYRIHHNAMWCYTTTYLKLKVSDLTPTPGMCSSFQVPNKWRMVLYILHVCWGSRSIYLHPLTAHVDHFKKKKITKLVLKLCVSVRCILC